MAIYDNKTDDEKARWYSNGAKFYVQGRPRYPATLIKAVAAVAEWANHSRVLEIGSGPGTATQDFVRLGGRFTCVEPNAEFVAIARNIVSAFPDVAFEISTFEQADLSAPYDIVLAASSFHWLDPKRAVQRINEFLAPNGYVALLWNKEPQSVDQQVEAVEEAFRLSGFTQPIQRQSRDEVAAVFRGLASTLEAGGYVERLFCHVEVSDEYSTEQFVALHRSLSPFLTLTEEKQESVARDLLFNLNTLINTTIKTTRISAAHIFQKSG